jgi:hypothetical protein
MFDCRPGDRTLSAAAQTVLAAPVQFAPVLFGRACVVFAPVRFQRLPASVADLGGPRGLMAAPVWFNQNPLTGG